MNRKGFTLVELLATLVVLGIVVGISVVSISSIVRNTKKKSEDVFVETIKDSMEVYLSSGNVKKLNFDNVCGNTLSKVHGDVNVYKVTTTFQSVLNLTSKPITQDDLINPSNKEKCKNANNINIDIYYDDDYVYYYKIDKSNFGCLENIGEGKNAVITNLPVLDSGGYFQC